MMIDFGNYSYWGDLSRIFVSVFFAQAAWDGKRPRIGTVDL